MEKNQLYCSDNVTVLREHMKDGSADLIYLDPPFNSSRDYNVLFAERDGTDRLPALRRRRRLTRFPKTGKFSTSRNCQAKNIPLPVTCRQQEK